jgi:hypothetical protein
MRIEKPKWTLGLTVVLAMVVMLGFSLPAMAQEEELTPEQQAAMEQAVARSFEDEITVTGSLIPRVDLEALSPVTTLEVEQELIYSGVNRIEDLVVSLPQPAAGLLLAELHHRQRRLRYGDHRSPQPRRRPHPGAGQRAPDGSR